MKGNVVYGCSHGFAIHFGAIVPPDTADIVMIAPKGPGHLVRSEFEKGAGVPCLVAVKQDASGSAKDMALAYAPPSRLAATLLYVVLMLASPQYLSSPPELSSRSSSLL